MVGAHFVDIKSHVVPLLVAKWPAWQKTQDQDAVQAHRPLAAAWQVSYSTLHNTWSKDTQLIRSSGTGLSSTQLSARTILCNIIPTMLLRMRKQFETLSDAAVVSEIQGTYRACSSLKVNRFCLSLYISLWVWVCGIRSGATLPKAGPYHGHDSL